MFNEETGLDFVVVGPDAIFVLVLEGGFDFAADVAGGLEPALGGLGIFAGGEDFVAGLGEGFAELFDFAYQVALDFEAVAVRGV